MTDVKALLGDLRKSDAKFEEAQTVVDLVRASGDMLERMRERKGWSQTELAERLGVTTARISQLESGTLRNAPSLKMMARVAHACGETIKLVACDDGVTGVQAVDAVADMSDVAKELAALRAEVRELRAVLSEDKTITDVEVLGGPYFEQGIEAKEGYVEVPEGWVNVKKIRIKAGGAEAKLKPKQFRIIDLEEPSTPKSAEAED